MDKAKIDMFHLCGDFCTAMKLQPEQVIDTGMFGEIVLTKSNERRIVVKKFTLLDKGANEKTVQTFISEVKIMKSLNHPFVMKCLFAGECPEYMAICMDYFQRGTLLNCVGEIGLELSELCVTQVACALRYLHKNNIVHLDVKLENIFMDVDFNATLGDFGLAVEMAPQQKTLTRKLCGGSPFYFAPEYKTAALDDELDPYKLDSYCLGVVLWALVMHRYPNGNANYFIETRRNHDLPSHIRFWLLRLLNRWPYRRPRVTDLLTGLRKEGAYRYVIDNN